VRCGILELVGLAQKVRDRRKMSFGCLSILLVGMIGRIWNGLGEVTRQCTCRNRLKAQTAYRIISSL